MSSDSRVANQLDVIQDMISISAERLEGLRTECVTSASLTQQEIRSLETKLVRMFSELLLTKELLNERIPASGLPHTTGNELKQWLSVVGLSQETLTTCLSAFSSLEQLLEQNEDELRRLIPNNPKNPEDLRRLTKASQNLKKCIEFEKGNAGGDRSGSNSRIGCTNDSISSNHNESKENFLENLFWDSWDSHNQHHHHHRGSVGNIGMSSPRTQRVLMKQTRQFGSDHQQSPLHNSNLDESTSFLGSTLTPTLTPSPPISPNKIGKNNHYTSYNYGGSLNGTPVRRPAGTPPPMKKLQTLINNSNQSESPEHWVTIPTAISQKSLNKTGLTPSEKHNILQVAYTDDLANAESETTPIKVIDKRSRKHPNPSPESYSSASSDLQQGLEMGNNNLQVPRSPGTPIVTLGMQHTISHRFIKAFKMMATCELCQKQMFFGLRCKECKYLCHKECGPQVPPSCGCPPEFVKEFKKTLYDSAGMHNPTSSSVNTSPNLSTLGKNRLTKRLNKPNFGMNPESSSPASSCNGSTPSSPAPFNLQHQQQYMIGSGAGANIMSSSGGGSSSTSSNMISTPSSFHKNSCQFNFPDVTITSNFNHMDNNSCPTTTIFSSQSSNNDLESIPQSPIGSEDTTINSTTTVTGKSNATDNEQHGSGVGGIIATNSATAANGFNSMSSSINSTVSGIGNTSGVRSGNSSITMSMISTHSGTFFQRKLSSAGVDKRGPELTDTFKSNDSDKTVSLSESNSADTDSERTPVRLDSTEDADSINWPRQNSLSAKEWDIPYGDLHLLEIIGKGQFGTVHRALWHGPVAVKLLKEDYLHDEHMLEAFRLEVANFKKTRHENLVLFMGACMNPPFLAIVTSLCKGNTLHTYIHTRHDKFAINRTTLVAQQIAQGMGYLHARGIVHKDLRTKNIFLENGKVIITDFGLFSSTKLNYCDMLGLCVPSGWLCYLSPELMRALLPKKPSEEVLPFTKASDVYSFGTVWYELLCSEFPFRLQPAESIIWQVGRGMKQTLANLHTSRDVKDILMLCWHYHAIDRPDFQRLLNLLEKLPKKRLARSPSHPVQFTSRSAESVF